MLNTNAIQREDETMPVVAAPMKKLDLGCGDSKAEGFIGVDQIKTESTDVVHDLTVAPWPFEDDSIDEARANHFFEHLTPPQRIVFMNELHRVLKKGAGCMLVTPRGHDRQVQDFTHQWPPIVEASYFYFCKEWLDKNNLSHYRTLYGITADFEIRPVSVSVTPEFAGRNEEHKVFAIRNYTNAATDLVVLVVKR